MKNRFLLYYKCVVHFTAWEWLKNERVCLCGTLLIPSAVATLVCKSGQTQLKLTQVSRSTSQNGIITRPHQTTSLWESRDWSCCFNKARKSTFKHAIYAERDVCVLHAVHNTWKDCHFGRDMNTCDKASEHSTGHIHPTRVFGWIQVMEQNIKGYGVAFMMCQF